MAEQPEHEREGAICEICGVPGTEVHLLKGKCSCCGGVVYMCLPCVMMLSCPVVIAIGRVPDKD